jgi:hypothetical protein
MASEADIQAERKAYAEEKEGLEVMVIGHFGIGTAREVLTEEGGFDLYKAAKAKGYRPSREQPARPAGKAGFLRAMTGTVVHCQGNTPWHWRELAREGAEHVWDDDEEKGWFWGRIER